MSLNQLSRQPLLRDRQSQFARLTEYFYPSRPAPLDKGAGRIFRARRRRGRSQEAADAGSHRNIPAVFN